MFYFSKWLSFSAAALVMMSAGLAYTFSIYADALKHRFQISQIQLGGLGTACNLGGYLALPAGLLFDSLKSYNRYMSALSPYTILAWVHLSRSKHTEMARVNR